MPRGRPPEVWTEEQRQRLRDLWTAEKRLALAMKRKERPQGSRDPAWWTPARRAAHAELKRRQAAKVTLDEAFAMADRVRERLRGGW